MLVFILIAAVVVLAYVALDHRVRLETVEVALRAVPAELKAIEERAAQAVAVEAKKL